MLGNCIYAILRVERKILYEDRLKVQESDANSMRGRPEKDL